MRRAGEGARPSGTHLSNTAARPPGRSTRSASRIAASGSGTTARTRCSTTASNDASGSPGACASITRPSTGFPSRAARARVRSTIAGVRSPATVSTPGGIHSRSSPVPHPTISTRSPGRSASSSSERRRCARKPATRS